MFGWNGVFTQPRWTHICDQPGDGDIDGDSDIDSSLAGALCWPGPDPAVIYMNVQGHFQDQRLAFA
ncbi:MAG: hypothetical protein R2911_21880 [Caldilineaceae bacterium]